MTCIMCGESHLYLLDFVPSYCSNIYGFMSPMESLFHSYSSLYGLTVLWLKQPCSPLHLHKIEHPRCAAAPHRRIRLASCTQAHRGSITSGWKEEESCTSEWFCVLGRGLPSPKTQNHSRVQDSSSFPPRVMEPVSPTIKRRNLHVLPWS